MSVYFSDFAKVDFWTGNAENFSPEPLAEDERLEEIVKAASSLSEIFKGSLLYINNYENKKGDRQAVPVVFTTDEKNWTFAVAPEIQSNGKASIGAPLHPRDLENREASISEKFLSYFNVCVGKVTQASAFETDPHSLRLRIKIGKGEEKEATLPDTDTSIDWKAKKVIVLANLKPECRYDDSLHILFYQKDRQNIPYTLTTNLPTGTVWYNGRNKSAAL